MEVSKYIAQQIKALRKERGLTQKELGNLVGVKDNTISGYEHNINDPGNDMLFMLANALHVSINELFPETITKAANSRLSVSEREYIEKYRALSDGHREAVDGLLNLLYEQDKSTEAPKHEQLAGRVNRVIRSGDTVPIGLDILPKTIEIDIPVEDNNERAMLHRLLDEELDKEKEERRASSSGKSARGGK